MRGSIIFSSKRSNSSSACDGATGFSDFSLAFSALMIATVVAPKGRVGASCATQYARLRVIAVHTVMIRNKCLVIIVPSRCGLPLAMREQLPLEQAFEEAVCRPFP